MKKISIQLLIALAITASVQAQKKDTAIATAHYLFSHMRDTTQPTDIYTENMMLYLGSVSSLFQSYDRITSMKEQAAKFEQMSRSGGPIHIDMRGVKMGSPTSFYKDYNTAEVFTIEKVVQQYLIQDSFPKISWTIGTEKKNINGMDCQNAVATFRGRTYEAWFAPQLPYSNGPWKLGGLPGLIIEASDTKKQVMFSLTSFEDSRGKNITFGLPDDHIKTTAKEFKRMRDATIKNTAAAMGLGAVDGVNGSVKISSVSAAGPKKQMNNPVELTNN